MDIIDSKYIGLVSSRLEKFKKVKANLYNFRCPICGDSQKHRNKARGYILPSQSKYKLLSAIIVVQVCHLIIFFKRIDSTLHKQYVMEKF